MLDQTSSNTGRFRWLAMAQPLFEVALVQTARHEQFVANTGFWQLGTAV